MQQVEGLGDWASAKARALELCGGKVALVEDDAVRGKPSKLAGRRTAGRSASVRSKYGRKKL